MNSTHATVGISATSAMAALTTILTGVNGLSTDKASAWAWIIVSGAGAIFGAIMWFVKWKWPEVPPLPGQIIEVQPTASRLATAVVLPKPGDQNA